MKCGCAVKKPKRVAAKITSFQDLGQAVKNVDTVLRRTQSAKPEQRTQERDTRDSEAVALSEPDAYDNGNFGQSGVY